MEIRRDVEATGETSEKSPGKHLYCAKINV